LEVLIAIAIGALVLGAVALFTDRLTRRIVRVGLGGVEVQLSDTLATFRHVAQTTREATPDPSETFIYPDYVDRDALNALAEAHGVGVDPVQLELGQ
jgi:hypothetical protein